MKNPNILFIMTDEQRYDCVGYENNAIIRTPNLDKLAMDGVVFHNAYTPSPICIPARQCMMAGQLPKTCNCEKWATDLTPNYMTFARQLSRYGYNSVVSGKLHHMGIDQMQGWNYRIAGDMQVNNKFLDFAEGNDKIQVQQGIGKWSDAQEIQKAGIGEGRYTQKYDRFALTGALDFITDNFIDPVFDRPNPNQPLLLKISFLRPHYQYLCSKEKFNYYQNRVKIYDEKEAFDHPFLSQRQVIPEKDVSLRELTRATAAYYGMIEEIDDDIGKVLMALEDAGQDIDDWVIIFTSDHGEMLGQHGIWEKQKFFEASVKVPLFIRYPKKYSHKDSYENVNLCDLFATICDLANIPTPDGLDSRSLVPLMQTENNVQWDNETISQFEGVNLMIKRDNLKYQYYGKTMPEVLFDLGADPDENINFIDNQKYTDVIDSFRKRCEELGYM